MTTSEHTLTEHAAVKDLGRGVALVSLRARTPRVPTATINDDAHRVERRDADIIIRTPGGNGSQVLLAPTESMVVRKSLLGLVGGELLEDVGGADRFADAETALLDLQWRLNLLGHRVVAEEGPLPTGWSVSTPRARALRWKGVLTMIDTDLAMPLRGRLLSVAQVVAIAGSLDSSGTNTAVLDLQRSPGGDDVGDMVVPARGLAGSVGVDAALDDLAETRGVRKTIQDTRRVPRHLLLPLLRKALPTLLSPTGDDPAAALETASLMGLDQLLDDRLRVLTVCSDAEPSDRRCRVLSEELKGHVSHRIARTSTGIVSDDTRELPGWTADQVAWADVIVLEGVTLDDAPGAASSGLPLVADLTTLDVTGWLMNGPRTRYRAQALDDLISRADLVLAADPVQRDVLLGALAGTERINAEVYDDDPSLASLISIDPDGSLLAAYCLNPARAADASASKRLVTPPRPSDLAVTLQYLREGGLSMVAAKAMGRIRRLRHATTGKAE